MSDNNSEINNENLHSDSDDRKEIDPINEPELIDQKQMLNAYPKWINNRGEEVKEVFGFNENAELVKENGKKLLELMDNWDKKMMQRMSKAYDDVENFPNKFLADYLFILDEIKGDIPNVSEGILKSLKSHDEKWVELKKEIDEINQVNIPEYNKELWSIGIGALN